MKRSLTKEQSARLIEQGVPREKASTVEQIPDYDNPIFTLTDILEILPKEIKIENKENRLITEFNSQYAFSFYYGGKYPISGS